MYMYMYKKSGVIDVVHVRVILAKIKTYVTNTIIEILQDSLFAWHFYLEVIGSQSVLY